MPFYNQLLDVSEKIINDPKQSPIALSAKAFLDNNRFSYTLGLLHNNRECVVGNIENLTRYASVSICYDGDNHIYMVGGCKNNKRALI
ncbi:hypothetical protein PPL_02518 [Heterostelium album PN500]|uniref:Uncharacterized protein n=1 Tax=Heterostelium pallidum (strain ATCC 26659 / Pp 5 / PN500) TaxID=670386 RepID=D3B2A9_HETP5|nr:hypothetical protein PPL_02518 [Heterostelium album PN500]EFA84484.1 hypothetical protein PPL_02518 [Heterostelium album PN500]|eukprot:XP_020436598.1 hypothetical protein PPL_02518 [Heterostelium album PN500]